VCRFEVALKKIIADTQNWGARILPIPKLQPSQFFTQRVPSTRRGREGEYFQNPSEGISAIGAQFR
jgi:hypothetical protein